MTTTSSLDKSNNAYWTKKQLISDSIEIIRKTVLASIQRLEVCASECNSNTLTTHDPWDENFAGVSWIHNELFAFASMRHIAGFSDDRVKLNILIKNKSTVSSVQTLLMIMPEEFLTSFHTFIKNGGTSNKEHVYKP